MVTESGYGERIGGVRYRAPHGTPHPLINKTHPAAAQQQMAPRHARTKTARKGRGAHRRATVVAGGNPATIQLEGQDVAYTVPLAKHVDPATVVAGGTVVTVMFDEANPGDALIVATY